ncbi:uncharacterized protein LOC132750905 isoform X1 [Ruditapes philippinarum]|uniref:uncharacterized protein LOC132750905 isoform X1 n=1 Tax=Ruditapes philippinarum TaxID=129788 RepID=UPI00295AE4E1|nr:uncharacterized protein LOC132750905 isoform X1 [Ruditapes philippinarum]
MYPTWPSSNAVDGDMGQYVGDGATCVATKTELNPYIIIDLGAEYILTSVKIYKQLDVYDNDEIEFNIQLLLMEKNWTSYGIFEEDKKLLKPSVATRLVRLQVSKEEPVALRICEIIVFAVSQEDSEKVIHVQSKPYMQMRFSLSNKYNDVVKEEAAFVYSVKQELAILTNFSEASFQNMKVSKKDPLQVELELHSTDGDLKKLSKMLETIDMLCGHGLDMTTEDGSELTIIAGSLQYHVMYTGHAGSLLYGKMLVAVCVLVNAILYL